jgi:hypothetical protein
MGYLFVDLDKTLIHCTSFSRELTFLVKKEGLYGFMKKVYSKKAFSKLQLKTLVSEYNLNLDYSGCLNKEVLRSVLEFRSLGYRVILATGAMTKSAKNIVYSWDFVDEVIGSTVHSNLKGTNKLKSIVDRVGDSSFVYMGDSRYDLVIFNEAQFSYLVSSSLPLKLVAGIRYRNRIKFLRKGKCFHDLIP